MPKPSITNPCPECFGTRYHLNTCTRRPKPLAKPTLSVVEDPDEVSFRGPDGTWITESQEEHAQRQARYSEFVKVIQDSMTKDEIAAFTAYHRERGAKCPACGAEAFWIRAVMSSSDLAWMTDHAADCRFLYFDTRQAGNV
jgi:hypothetical protein